MTIRRPALVTLFLAALIAFTALWSPTPSSADGTNLLGNPGCENGTGGFQPYNSTIAAVTAVKRSGASSCKVTATAGPFYSLQSTQSYANPVQGRTFTGAAWVRSDAANGRYAAVALRERGGGTADRTVYGTALQMTTTWQLVTVSTTITGAGRAALDFYVVQDPGATGQVFYADDMSFQLTPASPSGQAMPVGDLPGWRQILTEDFSVSAATGTWGASCSEPGGAAAAAQKIVYTGATGARWHTYPDCYLDTNNPKRPYRSAQVLSAHDGVLDFSLHNVDGQPAGANPAPVLNNATNDAYQTYGRYTYRFRTDTASLSEYHVAWLLWPEDESKWKCAESDFPEANLDATTVAAFAHYGCSGAQDQFLASIDFTQWHTFTQEWAPGVRRYYLDGTLIGTSTNSVYAGRQRFQMQTESAGDGTHAGHLLVDWVAIYAYQP